MSKEGEFDLLVYFTLSSSPTLNLTMEDMACILVVDSPYIRMDNDLLLNSGVNVIIQRSSRDYSDALAVAEAQEDNQDVVQLL